MPLAKDHDPWLERPVLLIDALSLGDLLVRRVDKLSVLDGSCSKVNPDELSRLEPVRRLFRVGRFSDLRVVIGGL